MIGITIGLVVIASLGMFGAPRSLHHGDVSGHRQFRVPHPREDLGQATFDPEHVDTIRRHAGSAVYPVTFGTATVWAIGWSTAPGLRSLDQLGEFTAAQSGRLPDPWRSGALVGTELTARLEVRGGDRVRVDGRTFRVTALLEPDSQATLLQTETNVLVPERRLPDTGVGQVVVRGESPPAAFQLAETLRQELDDRRERYEVVDFQQAVR